MALPDRYDIHTGRGEAWSEVFTLTDETGAPVDLTGRDVSVFVAATPELELLPGSGLDVTPATGRVTISLTGDQTRTLARTTWALWLDRDTPTADVLVAGNVYVIGG